MGGLLRVEGRAVLSPRTQERSCTEPGVLMADRAGLGEHVDGSFIGRAGIVVEVYVVADGLLEEPGDVLDVCGGDTVVGLCLCPGGVLGRRMQA